ncbi:hypothetical protein LRS10_19020 [Phenylobacterium sp. J426]|uniref:hypothetical protein n=1 Tax=Phenylobacterium sp. J426 TaxID=2898439 RepID=UPI002150BF32|nr:hypothetical protein [Phenylobacterium sp. J426]MCR5876052.1 hypothetical protein [Phenylobacterium sp. J426]
MDEVGRLIALMAIAGGAFTVLGAAFVWHLDESRRIRRSLKKILRAEPHALLIAPGRGKGIGFDFGANNVAVTWDTGAWCLEYRVEELMGAELIVDGKVAARTHRGEQRRALDHFSAAEDQVRLRFVFDDPAYPDFVLELWTRADQARKKAVTAAEAVQEGARWIARMESVLRRPAPRRGSTLVVEPPKPSPAPATPAAPASAMPLPFEDADDDDGDTEHAA